MLSLLLISDRPEEQRFLETRLSRQGYSIILFDRSAEPLTACLEREQAIDAVFMPSRDLQLLDQLRTHEASRDATVICMASQTSQLSLDEGTRRGCDVVIKRPSSQEEILQALLEVFEKREIGSRPC